MDNYNVKITIDNLTAKSAWEEWRQSIVNKQQIREQQSQDTINIYIYKTNRLIRLLPTWLTKWLPLSSRFFSKPFIKIKVDSRNMTIVDNPITEPMEKS